MLEILVAAGLTGFCLATGSDYWAFLFVVVTVLLLVGELA